jgi:hypothetical protein
VIRWRAVALVISDVRVLLTDVGIRLASAWLPSRIVGETVSG